MICEYLAKTSKDKDGNLLSFSTPESNHSAIVNIYRTARLKLPENFDTLAMGWTVRWSKMEVITGARKR
jgi:hypothetical protein